MAAKSMTPRSSNPDHIRENIDLFSFELTKDAMEQIHITFPSPLPPGR